MLGKLFAHEWKDSWKLMTIMNITVLALSAVGAVFFHRNSSLVKPLFESFEKSGGDTLYYLTCTGYFMLLVFSIAVLAVGCTIYFYIRFYRNLYTDQGYLMHTLPVNEHQLILSKTFVCLIWRIISALAVTAGIIVLMMSAFGDDFDLADILEGITGLFEDFGVIRGFIFIILIILLLLGKALFTAYTGYVCISIGQLAAKNKVLAAIGTYFGIRVLIQIISTFGSQYMVMLSAMAPYDLFELFESNENAVLIGMTFLVLIVYLICAAMYMIVYSIMNKRLNLE